MCAVLWQALCLILDSTTDYGVFFVIQYLLITSFLCDTKHPLFKKNLKI